MLADGDVLLQVLDEAPQLPLDARMLEDALARFGDHGRRRREQVHELARIADALDELWGGSRRLGHERDEAQVAVARSDEKGIEVVTRLDVVRHPVDARDQIRLRSDPVEDAHPFKALHGRPQHAVRPLDRLVEQRGGAERIEILGRRRQRGPVTAADERDEPVSSHEILQHEPRSLLVQEDRRDGEREDDSVAERENGEDAGHRKRLLRIRWAPWRRSWTPSGIASNEPAGRAGRRRTGSTA